MPVDLQKMRFSAALRASPFKRSSSRGGFAVPETASARRFLNFEPESPYKARPAPTILAAVYTREVPDDVLADPQVQEAIAAM